MLLKENAELQQCAAGSSLVLGEKGELEVKHVKVLSKN